MIRLTTLGQVPGQQAKRAALLAHLALARPRGAQRRDALLAMFWPELDAERARAALRQALHALRKDMGAEAIVSTGTESLALDPARVSCDAWDLDAAAERGDHDRVLALHQGELLAGLHLSDAPAFERWLDAERARVRETVRASAWALAESARAAGDAPRTVGLVRRAIGLSEFDEAAVRRGMRLLAGAGERAAALALYERFAEETRAELAADPSAETRALAAELRQPSRELVSPPAPAAMPTPVPEPMPAPAVTARPNVRRPRRFLVAGLAVVVALTTALRIAGSTTAATDPRRVRVEPIRTAGESAELGALASLATDRVRAALVRGSDAQVVWPASADDRAGTVVRGSLRRTGALVELRGEVVDRATGTIVRAIAMTDSAGDSLVARFTDRLSAAVATALYPGWGTALSQPPSLESYRLFVGGMRDVRREQHDLALAAFRRAFDADSAFTAAGLLAAGELLHMRRHAAAESLLVAIGARRAELPPVDARLLEWSERTLRGDRVGARAAMQALTALAPTADLAWIQLAIDNVETARPAEALAALERVDRDAEFGEGWPAFWATRAEALHVAGAHERELAAVRDGLRRHPELRALVTYELRALAALGRVREVEAGAAALAAEPPSSALEPGVTMRQTALELAAHGHEGAARAMLRRAIAWYAAPGRPGRDTASLAHRLAVARTRYLADDRAGARAAYDSVLREHPRCVDCVGALGVLAARGGDRAAAERAWDWLGRPIAPFVFGRPALWQARIAATLGDGARAAAALNAAFASGAEFDVLTHADADLRRIGPDSIYRAFAHGRR